MCCCLGLLGVGVCVYMIWFELRVRVLYVVGLVVIAVVLLLY